MEATGPEALTCKVFILVMTVVEKTLGTGKTRHALDTLLQHIGSIPARSGRIVRLKWSLLISNISLSMELFT